MAAAAPAIETLPRRGNEIFLAPVQEQAIEETQRQLVELIGIARQSQSVASIKSLLQEGDVDGILGPYEQSLLAITPALSIQYDRAGAATSASLPEFRAFDSSSQRSLILAQSRSERIRRQLVQPLSAWYLAVLQVGADRGLSELNISRLLVLSVGLTAADVLASDRFRALLEAQELASGTEIDTIRTTGRRTEIEVPSEQRQKAKLSTREIDAAQNSHRNRTLARRLEAIGTLEAQRAVHEGFQEAALQAFEDGEIEVPIQIWHHRPALSKNPRMILHAPMNLQERQLGEPFVSGGGTRLMKPGDPNASAAETLNCKCVLSLRT